ncbi:MAG: polyprenyl synthetase family protein [Candidatus Methanoplasma sp.]|jgi:octaprenyl-diphosphate synthase|nr:polyprenyl synthetase family protein [Candidatus Methanoplasma sp.]
MAEPWYSSVSGDLEKVEELMKDTIRSDSAELTEVCSYVLSSNGKRIRPAMCLLAYYACGGKDPAKAIDVGAALEIIHNATLVHDDINDQGELRRGAKAAYKRYSIGKSIVAGDFLFALGFKLIGGASHTIVEYLVEASSAMGAGEFDQKDFEHNPEVVESDYMKIIEEKTARLIECSAKSGAYLAGAEAHIIDAVGLFAYKTGMAFQIIDDTLDVIGDKTATGKDIGSDIMEGKPTLPTIYAIQDKTHGKKIQEIFEKPSLEWEDVVEAIDLIKRTDSIPRCLDKAKSIIADALSLLDGLADSVYKKSLSDLAEYIVDRDR